MDLADALAFAAERWLPSLQQDLKDFLHVVCDDPDLDDPLREVAIGAVFYSLAPGDVIPDSSGVVGFIDDALALRVVLEDIRVAAPGRYQRYRDRLPEFTATVENDLPDVREAFGELWEPFRTRVHASARIEYKGKTAAKVMADTDDAAWLEDEVSELALKLDFKQGAIEAAARKAGSVVPMLKQKLLPTRR